MAHMGDNRNCVFYRNKENTKKNAILKKKSRSHVNNNTYRNNNYRFKMEQTQSLTYCANTKIHASSITIDHKFMHF